MFKSVKTKMALMILAAGCMVTTACNKPSTSTMDEGIDNGSLTGSFDEPPAPAMPTATPTPTPEPTPAPPAVTMNDILPLENGWNVGTTISKFNQVVDMIVSTADAGLQVRFPVDNPSLDDAIEIEKTIDVPLGILGTIGFQVWDQYASPDNPGIFEMRAYVNGKLIWTHDVSGDDKTGWLSVSAPMTFDTGQAKVQVQVIAVSEPQENWGWGRVASVGLRNIKFTPTN